jgi:hypothetical protein
LDDLFGRLTVNDLNRSHKSILDSISLLFVVGDIVGVGVAVGGIEVGVGTSNPGIFMVN